MRFSGIMGRCHKHTHRSLLPWKNCCSRGAARPSRCSPYSRCCPPMQPTQGCRRISCNDPLLYLLLLHFGLRPLPSPIPLPSSVHPHHHRLCLHPRHRPPPSPSLPPPLLLPSSLLHPLPLPVSRPSSVQRIRSNAFRHGARCVQPTNGRDGTRNMKPTHSLRSRGMTCVIC